VIVLNPALSARRGRYEGLERKTPEITADQARGLLTSIDTSHAAGPRDRAVLAVLICTAAPVAAGLPSASRRTRSALRR
jgi:hypothetical protein